MDKFQRLISESQFAASILGNPSTGTYELIPLDGDLDPPETQEARRALGFYFVGVLAQDRSGMLRSALDVELGDAAIQMLADAFARQVAQRALDRLRTKLTAPDDTAAWLEKLHALPDTRSN